MPVGLILGVEAEPTQEQFQELLEKGFVRSEGLTFEALSVSTAEAADRSRLRELYKAACAKEDWLQGIALAEDLEFADLVVQGGRLVVVTPPAPPPGATTGGIIAGVGFTPDEADVRALGGRVVLQPNRQYGLSSFSKAEASDDVLLIAAYMGSARQHGWSSAAEAVSVARHTIDGKQYLVIEPGEPTTKTGASSTPDENEKRGWLRRRSHRSESG